MMQLSHHIFPLLLFFPVKLEHKMQTPISVVLDTHLSKYYLEMQHKTYTMNQIIEASW
jgi:hypothetical protein